MILDAAALALARDPAASLTEIAAEAGVSRATAYRHFADTDAVRAALLEEATDVGRDILRDQLALLFSPEGPPAPLTEMVTRVLRSALPLEHRWSRAISSEPIPDVGLIDAFAPMATAILKRGQAAGELRGDFDPGGAARALIVLALHAVRRLHSGDCSLEEALAMVTPLVDGLRAAPAAR